MSTGMPRPLSTTVTDSSACTVTLISSAKPAIASSTELSTTSQTRWCKPISPVEPMYIAGRKRTASSPPRTLMDFASYLWPPCGVTAAFSLSPIFSPGSATSRVYLRRWTDSGQFGVRARAQNSFYVKQGRRICGLIRASPYPLISASLGRIRNSNRQPLECTRSHPFSQDLDTLLCCDNRFIYMRLGSGLPRWMEKKKGAQVSTFFTEKVVLRDLSDAHGHDDVAVAVRLVGERTHLAGGLFVLQLDADRPIGGGGEKI